MDSDKRTIAEKVGIRLATEPDMAYINDSWIRSYRQTSLWARRMKSETFYRNHRKIIHELLDRCPTVVAYDPESPSHLLGFACGERWPECLVMHWITVKFPFRGFKLARVLMGAFEWKDTDPVVCTHWTTGMDDFRDRFRLVYNPYLLFEQIRKERDPLNGQEARKDPQAGPTQ